MSTAFLFGHSLSFLWNDPGVFMCLRWWSCKILLFSSSVAYRIRNFYYHPLWPVVLGIFIIFPLWKFRLLHLSDKWIDHGAFAIGILFLLCFIIRHVTHSPIVQIDFTKGVFHFFSYMNIWKRSCNTAPFFNLLIQSLYPFFQSKSNLV
mgnify:CR=1 FL=1